MRRIISFVAFSVFFLFLSYFLTLPSYAQSSNCPITLKPPQVGNEYNGDVIIEIPSSSTCEFKTSIDYAVFFCYEPDLGGGTVKCASHYATKPVNSKTLIPKLDLITSNIGDKKSGDWYVTICLSGSKAECRNSIFATGFINVGVDPTPTPPFDLPKINWEGQQCTFQAGAAVTLKATNIQPDTAYHWWWNGNLGTNFAGTSGASDTELIFTIPGSETTKTGIRNVCIDKLGSRVTGQTQQCISLNFLSQTPQGDTSCKAINSGTEYFMLNKDNSVPLLYCAEGETENGTIIKKKDYTMQEWEEKSKTIEKCLVISTAIGDISTNPAEFIQRIFSLVLGLAGGIALLLIILAGYRFMASQGDPEKVVEARQQLTAAIVGLLFIIFSFVILQVIGVDILKIPGFE